MAYTAPATAVAGTVLTAAWLNTNLRDNISAIYGGAMGLTSQAALDFLYASSASQLARLAAGSSPYTSPRLNSAGTGWEMGRFVKAWGLVANAGTPSLTAGFNVTSVTDNGTGLTTMNFTTAIGTANYAALVGLIGTSDSVHITGNAYASGSFQVRTRDAAVAVDKDFAFVVIG